LQVHTSENSDLKEHCSVYALSSQTQTEFKQQCNHRHDERCEECKAVESTQAGIERLMFLCELQSQALIHHIQCWKQDGSAVIFIIQHRLQLEKSGKCRFQGEKGAADRMTAAAKSHIRILINEGTDVTNATQMKDAVLSHEGVKSVQMVWNQHMLLGWLVTCESPRLSFRCYLSNGYNQPGEEASKEGAFTLPFQNGKYDHNV
ncbi:unnamed protein product, partial [Porites lobata]